MALRELRNDQRRELIDSQQAYTAWREADYDFRRRYNGRMHWRKISGTEYLYRVFRGVNQSLGPRSPETERIKGEYSEQRTNLRRRLTRLDHRLKERRAINRAFGLGRVPEIAARILRKFDEVGLLGSNLIVVGTHAMFAYEARAGVAFDSGLTATSDVDLLVDTRRHLSLAVADNIGTEGLIGLLRKVDRSFSSKAGHYRAINDDGYFVDLIRPLDKHEATKATKLLADNDMAASAVLGLQWLLNAPRFEEIAMASDGLPVWMSCVDPRAFALHKYWLATQALGRDPTKKRRDASQARAVAEVARDYLGLPFNAKDLSALPLEFIRSAKELAKKGKKPHAEEEVT